MPFEFMLSEVERRERETLRRQHYIVEQEHQALINVDGAAYINFASNDYLGLRQDPRVLQAWVEGLELYGGGSGASPLVTGYSRAHQALSEALAAATGRAATLLFTSGYTANQALCQALFKDKDGGVLLADKLSHASLIEAGRCINGEFKRFRHNDMAHLQNLLEINAQELSRTHTLIASEGVFSMDGDSADVDGLKAMAKQHNAWLMLDDAHGFGVMGERGEGVAAAATTPEDCQIIMATLGKALGTGGAFVAGSQTLIDYLTNFSRHYIYSTAMPPAQAHASLKALELMQAGAQRETLQQHISYFRGKLEAAGFTLSDSQSAIQPIILGSPEQTMTAAAKLKALGIWVGAMRYPTVPKGTDRLRITLNSLHQMRDIDALIDALCIVRDAQ
ncbi:8-amino-7-oxononanoate synthase [Alteromonas flava]|uniref:8-amino-7-oxononanoate synthase n=1 Tax=Alteromonas flava TaxID=2048003 RepID=UPI000C288F25|nr:8-amino-7-oxononanoate synthase [Alteromonas flava]